MKKTNIILLSCFLVSLMIFGVFIAVNQIYKSAYKNVVDQTLQGIGGPSSATFNRFEGVATSSQMTLAAATDTRILATSTSRAYVEITNDGATTVYLSFNSDKAAASQMGLTLNSSSTMKLLPGENLYSGSIRAISAGTPTLTITEVNTDD